MENNIFYKHKNFTELSKEELDLYLDFTANVLFKLGNFERWEVEDVFGAEDDEKWNKKAVEVFEKIMKEREVLDDKIAEIYIKGK